MQQQTEAAVPQHDQQHVCYAHVAIQPSRAATMQQHFAGVSPAPCHSIVGYRRHSLIKRGCMLLRVLKSQILRIKGSYTQSRHNVLLHCYVLLHCFQSQTAVQVKP
jgi:hypothetical protein